MLPRVGAIIFEEDMEDERSKTMRAVVYHRYGGPEVLEVKTDVPVPECKETEVLVKMKSAAINPIDWKLMKGMLKNVPSFVRSGASETQAAHVGFDGAGVIIQTGSQVDKKFSVGQEVFFMAASSSTGSIADYFSVDQKYVAVKPPRLTFNQAASVPLASLTSYQALFTHGRLEAKQRVLILGGSGGTGTGALQMAHAKGAYVITTCSSRNEELVKSLGADQVVDYTKENFAQVLEEHSIDLVFDCVGGPGAWEDAKKVLKPRGTFVTIVGDHNVEFEPMSLLRVGYQITTRKIAGLFGFAPYYTLFTTSTNAEDLSIIGDMIEQGDVEPVIDSVYPLEEVQAAFEKSVSGRARGKIVLEMCK